MPRVALGSEVGWPAEGCCWCGSGGSGGDEVESDAPTVKCKKGVKGRREGAWGIEMNQKKEDGVMKEMESTRTEGGGAEMDVMEVCGGAAAAAEWGGGGG